MLKSGEIFSYKDLTKLNAGDLIECLSYDGMMPIDSHCLYLGMTDKTGIMIHLCLGLSKMRIHPIFPDEEYMLITKNEL